MKKSFTVIKVLALCALFVLPGCQSAAQQLQTSSLSSSPRNVVQVKDFRVEMKWCFVSPQRTAECEVVITSLYQDKKAGIAYPKMQDDQGKEYRMTRKDGAVGGQLMLAGQPYTHRIVTENLPTYVTKVRGVVGTFVAWMPDGTRTAHVPVMFTGIPVRTDAPHSGSAALSEQKGSSEPVKKTNYRAASGVGGGFWFGVIEPVVETPENEVVRLWKRGAHLHLREDGIIGYNWSEPKNYVYDRVNKWSQNAASFTLDMNGAKYTFDAKSAERPLVSYIQQGGGFKMTMEKKGAKL